MTNYEVINQKLDHLVTDVGKIEKHLSEQNGRIKKGEDERHRIELTVARLETRYNSDADFTHQKIEGQSKVLEKQSDRIWYIVKELGKVTLGVLVIISTVGSMAGLW